MDNKKREEMIASRKAEENFSKIFSFSLSARSFRIIKTMVRNPEVAINKEKKKIIVPKRPASFGSTKIRKAIKITKERRVERKIKEREDFIDMSLYFEFCILVIEIYLKLTF